MSGPNSPNTQGIYNELQTMMQGAKLSDGVTNTYANVFLAAVPDYTDALPCCVIILRTGDSKRRAFGGKIIEHLEIEIRSVVTNTTDHNTQEQAIVAIRDSIIPIFQQHANLNNTVNVYDVALKPGSEVYNWMNVDGDWYRIHQCIVVVAQEYTISTGIIG